MIPLIKTLFHEFFYHEDKARLWLRSMLGFVAMIGAQVFAYPWEVVRQWTLQEIAYRVVIAAMGAFALGIGSGGTKEAKP